MSPDSHMKLCLFEVEAWMFLSHLIPMILVPGSSTHLTERGPLSLSFFIFISFLHSICFSFFLYFCLALSLLLHNSTHLICISFFFLFYSLILNCFSFFLSFYLSVCMSAWLFSWNLCFKEFEAIKNSFKTTFRLLFPT